VIFCASFAFSLVLGQDIPPLSRQACSSQEQHAPNLCSPEVLAVLNHPETRQKKELISDSLDMLDSCWIVVVVSTALIVWL